MFKRRFLSEQSSVRRDTRLLLICFVLFALWHVSQHDLQSDVNSSSGGHCEICRLNHVPVIGSAVPVLFAVIFLSVVLRVAVDVPLLRSKLYSPRLARGPPSF